MVGGAPSSTSDDCHTLNKGDAGQSLTFKAAVSYFDIVPRRRPTLIQALYVALERIQEREQLTPEDPALIRLRQSILSSIAELETESAAPPKDPAA